MSALGTLIAALAHSVEISSALLFCLSVVAMLLALYAVALDFAIESLFFMPLHFFSICAFPANLGAFVTGVALARQNPLPTGATPPVTFVLPSDYSLAVHVFFLYWDIVLMLILAWYLSVVRPGKNAAGRGWWYVLSLDFYLFISLFIFFVEL